MKLNWSDVMPHTSYTSPEMVEDGIDLAIDHAPLGTDMVETLTQETGAKMWVGAELCEHKA